MTSLESYQLTAEDAARIAGGVLDEWAEKFTVSEKSRSNLVTEADFASQQAIHDHIRARFTDHGFLGEEGLERGVESEFRWVIDPLDGTGNYVHGFPYYCVSIGLQRSCELVVGVVFDPNRDEMFTAVRGGGAKLNGKPIRPSKVDRLEQAMVVASLPPGARRDHPAVQRLLHVMEHAQTVQRLGSAALNLTGLAAGRLDAFFSSSLKPWDIAAGALIVEEAGGRVTRMNGTPLEIEVPDLLATNGTTIHAELQYILSND